MRRFVALLLIFTFLFTGSMSTVFASDMEDGFVDSGSNVGAEIEDVDVEGLNVNAKSAILIEASTGEILYSYNSSEALPPASVTKIMTLLLVAEAIGEGRIKLEDEITVSENATSMGGSQIFLGEGEKFTVEELLKSTVIASANDAAVALAEHVGGSEGHFVSMMNKRAKELGMTSTSFENCTGLDDTTSNHVTSAYDIAVMSRELIKHDIILKYSNVWQDEIRGGEFILTNTNRLVRYYQGCTGLKTGSTDKAGFCVSATAKRNGMHLIAVIMGAPTRDDRNNAARALLDYGFAAYGLYCDEPMALERVPVYKGTPEELTVYSNGFTCLLPKSELALVEKNYIIPEFITGVHPSGTKVGEIVYSVSGKEIGRAEIIIRDEIHAVGFFDILWRIISSAIN